MAPHYGKATLKKLDPSIHNEVYVADLRKARIDNYGDPTTPGQRPELFATANCKPFPAGRTKGSSMRPKRSE